MEKNKLGRVYEKGLRIDDYLRTEVIGLFSSGLSYNEISLKTRVSKSTCFKIVQDFSKTGTVESVAKKTRSPTKLTKEVCTFIEFEKTKNPTIYTREIQSKLLERGVCTEDNLPSLTLINRCLTRDLDMSRKIVQQQPVETQTAAYDRRTDEFIARMLQYTPKQMHFFDEASVIQTSGNRRYGSSPRGQPALVWQRYASRCTYTVNLCCGYFGIDHFNILEGPSNALHMLNFFDEALQEVNDIGNPVLASGDCVILDNCGFHHHRLYENMLRNMLQRKNITLLFQPPYSPEYNVCEYIFRLMRDGLRENNSLTYNFTEYAIVNSITNIKDCDVKSLYAHCGYV